MCAPLCVVCGIYVFLFGMLNCFVFYLCVPFVCLPNLLFLCLLCVMGIWCFCFCVCACLFACVIISFVCVCVCCVFELYLFCL